MDAFNVKEIINIFSLGGPLFFACFFHQDNACVQDDYEAHNSPYRLFSENNFCYHQRVKKEFPYIMLILSQKWAKAWKGAETDLKARIEYWTNNSAIFEPEIRGL